jgi:hypothetical protein
MVGYTVPEKKATAKEQKYILHVGKKTILLTVHENKGTMTLYIGGLRHFCVKAQVMLPGSAYDGVFDIRIGDLPHVQYNQLCNLEGNFKRGVDTTMILRTMLTWIHTNYPHVTHLRFTDTSWRDCYDKTISLAKMSYLLYGKTWYQKHFDAFVDPDYASSLREAEERFAAWKSKITWDMLCDSIEYCVPYKHEFESAKTWQEFFRAVRDDMGVADFCEWVSPWIDLVMDKYMGLNLQSIKWYMPVVSSVSYTATPYQEGRGRRIRKTHKSPAFFSKHKGFVISP